MQGPHPGQGCVPSGGNMQHWRFLVVRDPAIKQAVAVHYKRAWDEIVGPRYRASTRAPGMDRAQFLPTLAAHLHKAPVWIVPCLLGDPPTRTAGASIYPAV